MASMRSRSLRPSRAAVLRVIAVAAWLAAVPALAQPNPRVTNPGAIHVSPANLPSMPPFDLNAAADSIQARLQGRAVGYAFVVSYRDQVMVTRAGGVARRAPDASPRPMTVDERFNVASVSKPITAAAVMRALHARPQAGRGSPLDQQMHRFLPSGWVFGPNVNQITIRELLQHKGGIRCETDGSWNQVRDCVRGTVQAADRGVYEYYNTNYALMRLILPRVVAGPNGIMASTPSGMAGAYRNYVRQHILAPAGIPDAQCEPIATNPALAYQHPGPVIAGTDYDEFNDTAERCGHQGWNLSARQLGMFVGALLYTDRILPQNLVAQMRTQQMGLFTGTLGGGWESGHGGFFPGKDKGAIKNPGEISTLIIGLENGVSVAAIVNSQIIGSDGTALGLGAMVKQGLATMMD